MKDTHEFSRVWLARDTGPVTQNVNMHTEDQEVEVEVVGSAPIWMNEVKSGQEWFACTTSLAHEKLFYTRWRKCKSITWGEKRP